MNATQAAATTRIIASGTREALRFSDYTEPYTQPYLVYWNGFTQFQVDYHASPESITPALLLTEDEQKVFDRTKAAQVWLQIKFREMRFAWERAAGDTVEVFKGRKCPKGIYTVIDTARGYWGDCCTLKSVDTGKLYTYINNDNTRRVDPNDDISCWFCANQERWLSCLFSDRLAYAANLMILADMLCDRSGPDDWERAESIRMLATGITAEVEWRTAAEKW